MTWEDITIEQYFDILGVSEKYASGNYNVDGEGQIRYVVDLLSAATSKDPEYFLEMSASEFTRESEKINFIHQKPKGRINERVTVAGKNYTIPIDVRNISTAQYIDYTETMKYNPNDIAMMCAIFCIPEGMKYGEGYDVGQLREIFFSELKIVDAIGISFFYRTFKKLRASYPKLFEEEPEEGDEESNEREGGQEESTSDSEGNQDFRRRWWANIVVKHVIDYTRLDIHKVLDLPVMEFLNYSAYCKSVILHENEKNKKMLDKIKRRKKK